jgi:hypothetical protein
MQQFELRPPWYLEGHTWILNILWSAVGEVKLDEKKRECKEILIRNKEYKTCCWLESQISKNPNPSPVVQFERQQNGFRLS